MRLCRAPPDHIQRRPMVDASRVDARLVVKTERSVRGWGKGEAATVDGWVSHMSSRVPVVER